ncbi:hypothetical protein VTK73DRAFT_2827 [Phialemonium thermophilum]|uniref:Uncharacterized protein n=1 Tax=Phialemonium thermophilum TaxID=223376 RepID=A0ABR3X244_9PEZI
MSATETTEENARDPNAFPGARHGIDEAELGRSGDAIAPQDARLRQVRKDYKIFGHRLRRFVGNKESVHPSMDGIAKTGRDCLGPTSAGLQSDMSVATYELTDDGYPELQWKTFETDNWWRKGDETYRPPCHGRIWICTVGSAIPFPNFEFLSRLFERDHSSATAPPRGSISPKPSCRQPEFHAVLHLLLSSGRTSLVSV